MNIALRTAGMTPEQFLNWAEIRHERYEFDGTRPVLMVGGTGNHGQIAQNIYFALRNRLQGTEWRVLGEMAITTIGNAVRVPDALVTAAAYPGTTRLIPGAVVLFEILSSTSERIDRIDKVREYRAIPTVLRYVILEQESIGLTVMQRPDGTADWTAYVVLADEILSMPEIGIEVPVNEFYTDVDLPPSEVPAEA